jgi:hypothetical protein
MEVAHRKVIALSTCREACACSGKLPKLCHVLVMQTGNYRMNSGRPPFHAMFDGY